MTILNEHYTLSNGVDIPKLGLGTWFINDDHAAEAVRAAIEIGYRNIDTAQAYGNERGVGEGVRTSGMGLDYIDLMLIHAPQPWDDSRGADYADAIGRRGRHWRGRTRPGSCARLVSPTSSSTT